MTRRSLLGVHKPDVFPLRFLFSVSFGWGELYKHLLLDATYLTCFMKKTVNSLKRGSIQHASPTRTIDPSSSSQYSSPARRIDVGNKQLSN